MHFRMGARGRGDDFVQHRHRDFAARGDADFKAIAQDLAQDRCQNLSPCPTLARSPRSAASTIVMSSETSCSMRLPVTPGRFSA